MASTRCPGMLTAEFDHVVSSDGAVAIKDYNLWGHERGDRADLGVALGVSVTVHVTNSDPGPSPCASKTRPGPSTPSGRGGPGEVLSDLLARRAGLGRPRRLDRPEPARESDAPRPSTAGFDSLGMMGRSQLVREHQASPISRRR